MVPTLQLPSQFATYHPAHLGGGLSLAAAGLLVWPVTIYACAIGARLKRGLRRHKTSGRGVVQSARRRTSVRSDAPGRSMRRNRRLSGRIGLRLVRD